MYVCMIHILFSFIPLEDKKIIKEFKDGLNSKLLNDLVNSNDGHF